MKIYKKNEFIWKFPDETTQEFVIKFVEDLGFELVLDESINFSDCVLICSVRNPYDRVLSLFISLEVVPRIALTKEIKNTLVKYFREWVNLCFDKKKLVVDLNDYGKNSKIVGCLKQSFFSDRKPDFFVKYENIIGDTESLGFILDRESFINEFKYDYKEFYDLETAKLVYEYFFDHFHLIGYDPFSFTEENLIDEVKIKFIHDTF